MFSPRRLRTILAFGALFLILLLMWQARAALVPFLVGAIMAALLSPLVDCIAGRVRVTRLSPGVSVALSIALVYLAFLGGLAALIFFFVPPIVENINDLVQGRGEIYEGMEERFARLVEFYEENAPQFIKEQLAVTLEGLDERGGELVTSILEGSVTFIGNSIAVATGYLVIPAWLVYALNGRRRASTAVSNMFPPNLRPDVEHVLSNAGRIINRYIRMQLILAVIVGLLSYLGLYLLDIPFAGPLAILLGFTELIVIIGPIIGGAIAVIVTLATEPGLAALWVLLLVIGVQQVENQFLVPRFQGHAIDMNPAIVIIMLVLVGQLFGLMGLLVALPVAAVLRDTYLYIYRRLGEVAERGDTSGIAPT